MGELFVLEKIPTLKEYGYSPNIMKFISKKDGVLCEI
jgi:hypothetical protein